MRRLRLIKGGAPPILCALAAGKVYVSMPKYSKSFEREECAKMGRGLWHSIFALLLCWLPLVGLALAISGFVRQVVRMTVQHRARRVIFTIISFIVLVACIGVLVGEVYFYSRDPELPGKAALWVWQNVTGQENFPGADAGSAGYPMSEGDFTGYSEGDFTGDMDAGLYDEGDLSDEGDFTGEGDFADDGNFYEDDSEEPGAEAGDDGADEVGAEDGYDPTAGLSEEELRDILHQTMDAYGAVG